MKYPWVKSSCELTDYEMFKMWKEWAGETDPYVTELLSRKLQPGDVVTIFGLCERIVRECCEQKA